MSLTDPVTRYVIEAKPPHEALRRALIQLSGFLLVRTISGPYAILDFAPVEAARDAIAEAAEGLRSLRVPARAAHQSLHLEGALVALQHAVGAAFSRSDPDDEALFRLLEQAEKHLRAVGRTIPGFEAVDLRQACCAAHAGLVAFTATGEGAP